MTDDFAIEGEDGGYVPCGQRAAQLVVDEEGAISGSGTGFVAPGGASAALPATTRGAIVGSGVGFVPGPCRIVIDDFSDFTKAFPHAGVTRESLLYETAATTLPNNGVGQGVGGSNGGAWYEAHAYIDDEDDTLGLWWCPASGVCG